MSHPYKNLPKRAFWSTGVAALNPLEWQDIYVKRFDISPTSRIASAGSCFAQHIGLQFAARAFNYIDFEPAPDLLAKEDRRKFGYELFSARYGNIYTARQMLQLARRAYGQFQPVEDCWEQNGRFYDPFRPSIEPDGFASRDELEASREQHYSAVRRLFEETDIFVFTFGLTEAWVNKIDGSVYPTCPGTIAGTFSKDRYVFQNFSAADIERDMLAVIRLFKRRNSNIRFLFTVSPVPLTATATSDHVLVATTHSKSVLRTAAGELRRRFDFVDYFPSYEIVSASANRGMFFEPNMRSVSAAGVEHVMSHFFSEHAPQAREKKVRPRREASSADASLRQMQRAQRSAQRNADILCDEEKLEMVRG